MTPALRGNDLSLFASASHAELLRRAASTTGGGESPAHWIAAHLALAEPGVDIIHVRAWLPPADELLKELRMAQGRVRDATRAACTFAFGRRLPPEPWTLLLQLSTAGGAPLGDFGDRFSTRAVEDFAAHGDRALRVQADDGRDDRLIKILDEAIRLLL